MSADKIKVFFSEGESQKLHKLQVIPDIEWGDLLNLIAEKLHWSPKETRLWKWKENEKSWDIESSIVPLENLDRLKAEKVRK